jgi:putative nucleotidyltransferase with HDIG domain
MSSVGLDPQLAELIQESRARPARSLVGRDRLAALAMAGAFLAAAVPLAALLPSGRSPGALAFALLVAAYAVTSRATFEVRTGLVVPTQLVLVPMLFVLPLGAVPLCVAAGLLLGQAGDLLRGKLPLNRALLFVFSSTHSLGPVAVLALLAPGRPSWRETPVYVLALLVQYAFDFGSSATWEWLALGVRPSSQLRFMGWAYLVDAALAPIALAVAFTAVHQPPAALAVVPLVGLLAVFARERQVRIDHALELSGAYRGTALLLGDVVEADDEYTGSHSREVVDLAVKVADALEVDARTRRNVEFAGLLHDVGKIRIPAEIIDKPGPLTAEERVVIETHTIEGEQMLARVGGLLGEVGRIVRSCHERYDGAGYPDGIAGEAIPLEARIVACCDAYSAITTDRPYRAARSQAEAIAELERERGGQFDPRVVDALVACVDA